MNIEEQTRFKIMLLAHKEDLLEYTSKQTMQQEQSATERLMQADASREQTVPEIHKRHTDELTRIDAALGRMTQGNYGICTACGNEINLQRLETNPASPHCLQCVKK